MSNSKYLDSLSADEYNNLKKRLYEQQNGKCFICEEEIDLDLNPTNIDHIVPLANNGKDSKINFAITHESCNKSKLDADLNVAKILAKLEKIKRTVPENKQATLKNILDCYDGGKYKMRYKIEKPSNKKGKEIIRYSFSEIGDNTIYEAPIYEDYLSKEKTCFIEVPIEYIHHDDLINPRGINSSIGMLIKEFYKGNPQLHLSLARIEKGYLKVFDGQHKAVAQILLGTKRMALRLFINPDVDRLIETNTNAGSKLKQIAFDKSIIRQLHSTLYSEKISQYQQQRNLSADNFSFSEQDLVDYFKGEKSNIKSYIINSQKNYVTMNSELTDYIDFEGRGKEKPISYSSFEKTFLSLFINSKTILRSPMSDKDDENPRVLEGQQLIKLCNILAEKIYIGKFDIDVGTNRIEQNIINKRDKDITDNHLIAYRVSKEEILVNWLKYIRKIIQSFFLYTGRDFDEENLFQQKIPEQLWKNIENFISNFISLPVWKDRSLSSTIFSGKSNYDYWAKVFDTGNTPDGIAVLATPINFQDLLK